MLRQNFISRESFVEATEVQARESLLSIPVFVPNIQFVAENKMLQSFRFSYKVPRNDMEYQVDITILPLNDRYSRIGLRGRHVNGEAFSENPGIILALKDFESAISAAIKGDTSLYAPIAQNEKKSKKRIDFPALFSTSAGFLLLKKKLS